MQTGALILAVEPTPSLFHDLVLTPKEARNTATRCDAVRRAGRPNPPCGLYRVDARLIHWRRQAVLLTAEAPAKRRAVEPGELPLVRDGADHHGFATALLKALRGAWSGLSDRRREVCQSRKSQDACLAGRRSRGRGVARVASHCLAIRTMPLGLGHAKAKMFVAVLADRPIADAIFSFCEPSPTKSINRFSAASKSPT